MFRKISSVSDLFSVRLSSNGLGKIKSSWLFHILHSLTKKRHFFSLFSPHRFEMKRFSFFFCCFGLFRGNDLQTSAIRSFAEICRTLQNYDIHIWHGIHKFTVFDKIRKLQKYIRRTITISGIFKHYGYYE